MGNNITKKSISEIAENILNYKYDAVLFDMDGTLVDSMWMWGQIDAEYLLRFGVKVPKNLEKAIGGMSMDECADYFSSHFSIPDSKEQMKADWIEMSWQKYKTEVLLKEGVKEFISLLKERNILLGICTANSRTNTEACLLANEVYDYFSCIGTSENMKNGKPAPDIFLYAASKLNTNPSRCLCFDDIPQGIMAGKAAGMDTVAVMDYSSLDQDEEKRELADAYISGFDELVCEIKNIQKIKDEQNKH